MPGNHVQLRTLRNYSILDSKRTAIGAEKMKAYFKDLINKNTDEAVLQINNTNLNYSTLYLLKDYIDEYDLYEKLTPRNLIALDYTNEILKLTNKKSPNTNLSCDYIQNANSVLKWILKTDFNDDHYDDCDQVLDGAAAILTKVYNDYSALPLIINVAFNRYRKGFLINNLIWAFFEGKTPSSLIYVANYLLSAQPKDVELAQKLLKFIPGISIGTPSNQYKSFLNWLKENHMFLHYTSEGFQQTHSPIPYVVKLEAKYLYKFVSIDTGNIIESLTKWEKLLLTEFNKLQLSNKVLLSTFSFYLHHRNNHYWHSWIRFPISDQIRIAKIEFGGRV